MEVYPTKGNESLKVPLPFIGLGVGILLLDQLSKFLAYFYLPPIVASPYIYPYGGIGVFQNLLGIEFSLNYMINKGAAWGLFGDYQLILVFLRIFLIAGMILYLFKYNKEKWWQIPLIFIIAGAIGNVLDFFIYGHVIDMFHFVLWGFDFPVFNVADSAISIGIGFIFLMSLFKSSP